MASPHGLPSVGTSGELDCLSGCSGLEEQGFQGVWGEGSYKDSHSPACETHILLVKLIMVPSWTFFFLLLLLFLLLWSLAPFLPPAIPFSYFVVPIGGDVSSSSGFTFFLSWLYILRLLAWGLCLPLHRLVSLSP